MLSIEKAMFLEVCSGLSSGLKYRYPDIDVEGIPRPDTVVLDGDHLVELAALCRSDRPEGATLVEALSAQAEPLLTATQDSVVQKTHVEARRSPNDYSSLAKYWWPDEKSDDGLPYVRRDGEVNPDCYSERYDASRLVSMVESLQVLSLAAWLTGDRRYADCAARRIEAWFLDEATRQTPHFEYAQHIPGRHQTRAAAVIEARHLIYVTEAALLLESMNALTAEQSDGLRQWFRSLLDWLQNSETGQEAARAGNNIGFWYDLQRMAYASFTGDSTLVEYIALNSVQVRALDQIEPDGTLAMEMQRAHPQDYVSFTLVAMAQLSRYGDQAGVPLWDQQEADGRGFQVAHDWLGHQVESRQARQQAKRLQGAATGAEEGIDDAHWWSTKTAAANISDLTLHLGLVNQLAEKRQLMLTQTARHNHVHLEHIQMLEDKLMNAEKTIKSLRKHSKDLEADKARSDQKGSDLVETINGVREQIKAQQQESARLAERMAAFEQKQENARLDDRLTSFEQKQENARLADRMSAFEQQQQESARLADRMAAFEQRQESVRLADRMADFEKKHQKQWTLLNDNIESLKKRLRTLPTAAEPSKKARTGERSEPSSTRQTGGAGSGRETSQQAEIDRRDHKIDVLGRQVAELGRRLEKEQQKNARLLSSHSWRLMTPFRRLRHTIGRIAGSKEADPVSKASDATEPFQDSVTIETPAASGKAAAQTPVKAPVKAFDPLTALHAVTPRNGDALQRQYREMGLDQVADTFVLYRIIGNDLYPRHRKGQTRDNLRFILENEQPLPNCDKRWVVNRIVDSSEERAIIDLLEEHNQTWLHVPFDAKAYGEVPLDYQSLPNPNFLISDDFDRLPANQKKRIQTATYRLKNNYVMNNNGARNVALQKGRQAGKWVLPWDGNCFITPQAWQAITQAVTQRPWLTHFVVPMARIMDNTHLLESGFEPRPVEEPQLIFRHDTTSDFNEAFCYGRRPKIEMLWHLGVPGKWDDWNDELGDQPRRGLSEEAFQWGVAGWVARLFSGMSHMETSDDAGAISRNQHRQDAIMGFLERVNELTDLHAGDQRDMLLEETDNPSVPTQMTPENSSPGAVPFVFGISLRARSTTNDWPLVCRNLERTLHNLARQSDKDFQVYIAVHDIPEIDTQGLDVRFITVDFPVSFDEQGRPSNDKYRKKRVLGTHLHEQQMPAFYFMSLDADDLLHPDLVKTVRAGNSRTGYLIERGYMYDCSSQRIGRCNEHAKRFWEQCGSCAVFYIETGDLPVNKDDTQAYFSHLREHKKYPAVAREHGKELVSLEEYMGVYLINHGENHWSVYRGKEGTKERYVDRNGVDDAEGIAFHETWPELGASIQSSSSDIADRA
ncbi:alginate lyase family protein [Kushneria sp. EE4]